MIDQLLTTYTDLMEKLDAIPAEIAELQTRRTDDRIALAEYEARLKAVETAIVEEAGGFKSLGSNDADRKHNLAVLLASKGRYQVTANDIRLTSDAIAHMTDAIEDAERRYGAVGYQSRLHAALLNYLASAGTPVRLPEFMPSMKFSANGHSDGGAPSVSDAEAIGL